MSQRLRIYPFPRIAARCVRDIEWQYEDTNTSLQLLDAEVTPWDERSQLTIHVTFNARIHEHLTDLGIREGNQLGWVLTADSPDTDNRIAELFPFYQANSSDASASSHHLSLRLKPGEFGGEVRASVGLVGLQDITDMNGDVVFPVGADLLEQRIQHSFLLSVDKSAFPVQIVDFTGSGGLPSDADWQLSISTMGHPMWTSNFRSSVRLLVNGESVLGRATRDQKDPLHNLAITYLQRDLVAQLFAYFLTEFEQLGNQGVTAELEDPLPGTIGQALWGYADSIFRQPIETVMEMFRSSPERFYSYLQHGQPYRGKK